MSSIRKLTFAVANFIALFVLVSAGFVLVIQLGTVPADSLVRIPSMPDCGFYIAAFRRNVVGCSPLEPISLNFIPSLVALLAVTVVTVWFMKISKTDFSFLVALASFAALMAASARVLAVIEGFAVAQFLAGALVLFVASMLLFWKAIRSDRPNPHSRKDAPTSGAPHN